LSTLAPAVKTAVTYCVGLDLGQSRDFSALTVVEREEKYPPGTVFPEVTPTVAH
jgi:hypothetical protein